MLIQRTCAASRVYSNLQASATQQHAAIGINLHRTGPLPPVLALTCTIRRRCCCSRRRPCRAALPLHLSRRLLLLRLLLIIITALLFIALPRLCCHCRSLVATAALLALAFALGAQPQRAQHVVRLRPLRRLLPCTRSVAGRQAGRQLTSPIHHHKPMGVM